MVFIKLNANSFLTIHFHVINKTKNDLFLEYTLDKDFDFWGRKTVDFYNSDNNTIKANHFKIQLSKQYKLLPDEINCFFEYMKDSDTERIPFVSRFNQVYKEFKITDEGGNIILEKKDITNESFSRIETRSVYYILEISDNYENLTQAVDAD